MESPNSTPETEAVKLAEKLAELIDWNGRVRAAQAAGQAVPPYPGEEPPPPRAPFAGDPGTTPEPPPGALPFQCISACIDSPPKPHGLVVPGLLRLGEMLILSGETKSYKSYLGMHLGLAVATGSSWLRWQTNPFRVLYLNCELLDETVVRRATDILAAAQIPRPGTFAFSFLNLRDEEMPLEFLRKRAVDCLGNDAAGFGLLLIDPLYVQARDLEQNSASDMTRLLKRLRDVAKQFGAGVVVIAHFAKGDASVKEPVHATAGSAATGQFVDNLLTVRRLTEAGCFRVDSSFRDFPPLDPFGLRWTHPLFAVDNALDLDSMRRPGQRPGLTLERLLAMFTPGQRLTRRELKDLAREEGVGGWEACLRSAIRSRAVVDVTQGRNRGLWLPADVPAEDWQVMADDVAARVKAGAPLTRAGVIAELIAGGLPRRTAYNWVNQAIESGRLSASATGVLSAP